MNTEEIIEYYKNHSSKQTSEQFGISPYRLRKLLSSNGVAYHSASENALFNGNGHKKVRAKAFNDFLSDLDVERFYDVYIHNAKSATAEQYGIPKEWINKILGIHGLRRLTAHETRRLTYEKCYGSYEAGLRIEREKARNAVDWDAVLAKRYATNRERYGGDSPFCSDAVRQKASQTVLSRYGVENVGQIESVKQKIKDSSVKHFGGVGFASSELAEKTVNTMMNKYGVRYACLLPQCYGKRTGSNSKPNLAFEQLLNENDIGYSREFVIGKYRYDFKVGNILIEVDPSYSHNSTCGYKNCREPLDKHYHLDKSAVAEGAGFRCIHIFDWDDLFKIVDLLKPRRKVYARQCEVSVVDSVTECDYLCKHHLQNYVKSSVSLGLFYNGELVSLMSFGKPRYNNKYEFELLRYCSHFNVIGGAQRLFTHFLREYNPNSIISYCDRSKFVGSVYKELGFVSEGVREPSRHWYNSQSRRHITDNLLRQRGFDQLFGTNFGKGTSNSQLMLQSGFVEIYDCGQEKYTYTTK